MNTWEQYKEYCKILEISFDDSKDLDFVKKTYRTLALKHHPDKGGNEETFKEVNNAYEFICKYSLTIMDHKPSLKSKKDSLYKDGGVVDREYSSMSKKQFDEYFWKPFHEHNENRRNNRRKKWANNSYFRMQTSVKELFQGFEHLHQWDRKKECVCSEESLIMCPSCHNKGYQSQTYMSTLTVSSIHMQNDGTLRWYGMGDTTSEKVFDLIMQVELSDKDIFNLKYYDHKSPDVTAKRTFHVSELGSHVIVDTLDGQVKIQIPEDHIDGKYLRIKERGLVFNRDGKVFRSDLLVKINIYK